MNPLLSLLFSHYIRLGIWSVATLVVAFAIFRSSPEDKRRGFAVLSAGWALVNLLIIGASWRNTDVEPKAVTDFLVFNLVLNVGYIGVGLALWFLAKGFAKGAGMAVFVQGLALLCLDGLLFGYIAMNVPSF